MSCNFKISWARRRREMYYGCILPKTGLEAAYLGNVLPSSSGLITDESGNGNDAQLVDSTCAYFSGGQYVEFGSEAIHNGTKLDVEHNFRYANAGALSAKRDFGIPGQTEYVLRIVNATTITVLISDDGSEATASATTFTVPSLVSSDMHNIKMGFNAGTITLDLDGTTQTKTTVKTIIYSGTGKLYVGSSGAYIKFSGSISKSIINSKAINFAEGNGGYCYYEDPTMTPGATNGAVLDTFWKTETTDDFHYNLTKGFDIWTNGIAGQNIRVPIGTTCLSVDYTFLSSRPAVIGHNGAESKISFPTLTAVTNGDTPNPLDYASFEQNFNSADIAFSNTEAKKKRYMVFYGSAQSASNIAKILKCLGV